MNEEVGKAKTSGKIAQGVKEVGLNLLAKAVGLETPSLKNCQSHIDLHGINIGKLDKESKKLSEKIYEAMDEQEKLNKALKAAKATLPADKVGQGGASRSRRPSRRSTSCCRPPSTSTRRSSARRRGRSSSRRRSTA